VAIRSFAFKHQISSVVGQLLCPRDKFLDALRGFFN